MEVTNTLAYYDTATITAIVIFTIQGPVANAIKLFTAVNYDFHNKLERWLLASLYSLVWGKARRLP
jgi:hypothetical protein